MCLIELVVDRLDLHAGAVGALAARPDQTGVEHPRHVDRVDVGVDTRDLAGMSIRDGLVPTSL